ncbi:MAG: outer membrane protein assembly factor BamD [Lentisphaeria bacterium]
MKNSLQASLCSLIGTGFILICASYSAAQVRAGHDFPEDPSWVRDRFLGKNVNLAERARHLETEENYADAAKVYKKMQRYASTKSNRTFALYRRAECLFLADKYNQALKAFLELGDNYPRAAEYPRINQRLRSIAAAYASGEASFLGGKDIEQARDIYQRILTFAPAGKNAPEDTMRLAEFQQLDNQPGKAVVTYREVTRKFPRSKQAPYARLALAGIYLNKAKETNDQWEPAMQARRMAARYLDLYSEHQARDKGEAIVRAANEELARDLLYLGHFYLRPAHYRPDVARRYLSDLLREYDQTSAAREARVLMAQIEGEPVPSVGPEETGTMAEKELTPEELLQKRRRLPPLPDEDETSEPAEKPVAPLPIEDSERVKKWLRPIPDLGIKHEKE